MGGHIDGLSLLLVPFLDEMRAVSENRQRAGHSRHVGAAPVRKRAGGDEFLTDHSADRHAEECSSMAATKTSPKTTVASRATNSKTKSVKAADQRFQQAKRASILLKHVSDPTRLQVILILSEGERHVGALCASLARASRP